jgi:hypothetical protein
MLAEHVGGAIHRKHDDAVASRAVDSPDSGIPSAVKDSCVKDSC